MSFVSKELKAFLGTISSKKTEKVFILPPKMPPMYIIRVCK